MLAPNVELENTRPTHYTKKTAAFLKVDTIYQTITGKNKTAPYLLAQIIYWINIYVKQGKNEFYNSDRDFAEQIGCKCLKTFQRAKRKLIKLGIISVKVRFKGDKRVSYYELHEEKLNALIKEAQNPSSSLSLQNSQKTCENSKILKGHMTLPSVLLPFNSSVLFLYPQWTKCTFTLDKVSFTYIDTKTTTKIKNKYFVFTKNPPSNESQLENPSSEQKPMSGNTASPASEEFDVTEPPISESDKSKSVEKAVGTTTTSLKAETVKPEKSSKPKRESKNQNSLTAEQQVQFDQIWAIWPKRVKKQYAEKTFLVALGEVDFDKILYQTTAYAENEKKEGTEYKFILHLSTWLNDKRWTDEYPAVVAPQATSEEVAKARTDSPFAGFLKDNPSVTRWHFDGASFEERGEYLIVIQPNNFTRGVAEIATFELKKYFGKKSVEFVGDISEAKAKASVPVNTNLVLEQYPVKAGLDARLKALGHGINRKEIKENKKAELVSSNIDDNIPKSNNRSSTTIPADLKYGLRRDDVDNHAKVSNY